MHLPAGTKVTAGHVLTWGMNNFEQLGLPAGHPGQSTVPVRMPLPRQDKVIAISGGFIHSLALTTTGDILARGVKIIAPRHGVKLPAGLIATAIGHGSTALDAFVIVHRAS